MDIPNPPQDREMRNIIDKLAQFVARNGADFEQMTMKKQNGNPKFAFLFGGEHYNYYRYKVASEQAFLNKGKQAPPQPNQPPPVSQQPPHIPPVNLLPPLPPVTMSQPSIPWQSEAIAEQIRQSEQNLIAQHQVLMQQQQMQVDDAIRKAMDEKLTKMAEEVEVDLAEFDKLLVPITETCTKDAISAGKGWIFQHATTPQRNEVISKYLLKRITTPGMSFEYRLHLVYLINDVLHHCVRKNADDLKKTLEQVVVPIFCTTSIGIDDEKQNKLSKLLKLWENNKYFTPKILEQLKNPAASLGEYQATLITDHATIITPITQAIQGHYSMLQKQHQDFVAHFQAQQQLPIAPFGHPGAPPPPPPQDVNISTPTPSATFHPEEPPPPPPPHPGPGNVPDGMRGNNMMSGGDMGHMNDGVNQYGGGNNTQYGMGNSQFGPGNPIPNSQYGGNHPPSSQYGGPPPPHYGSPPSSHFGPGMEPPYGGPPQFPSGPPPGPQYHPGNNYVQQGPRDNYMHDEYNGPPFPPSSSNRGPTFIPPPPPPPPPQMDMLNPDISRPPPGYIDHDTLPPPPQPAHLVPNVPYYDLPAGLMVPLVRLEDHEYKALNPNLIRLPPPAPPTERLLQAVEMFYAPPSHDRPRNSEGWEQLGLYEFFKAKKQARTQAELFKKDQEKNGENTPDKSTNKTEPSRSPVKPSPPKRRYRETISPPPQPKPVQTSQPLAPTITKLTPAMSAITERSPSPPPPSFSQEPDDNCLADGDRRSPTPPSFYGASYGKLDESNKGHQLLKKMGWSGAGLGSTEQGIQEPINPGEVRTTDRYKGVGQNVFDPYETFRKNKGQAFISRMRARAEEASKIASSPS